MEVNQEDGKGEELKGAMYRVLHLEVHCRTHPERGGIRWHLALPAARTSKEIRGAFLQGRAGAQRPGQGHSTGVRIYLSSGWHSGQKDNAIEPGHPVASQSSPLSTPAFGL